MSSIHLEERDASLTASAQGGSNHASRQDVAGGQVFTIPPGVPFIPTLADALLDGALGSRAEIGDAAIYLPTRRNAGALAAALATRLDRLPRIIALGEVGAGALAPDTLADAALAPPIGAVERRLILARLVQTWANRIDRERGDPEPFRVPASAADAVALAADLEGLMDALTVEGVPWEEIANAVEAGQSRYFGLTLNFLRLAAEHWPKILAGRGAMDPAARGRALVEAEADRLARARPATPVILAGSTGSAPATVALAVAVAGLPRGALVLPGLDLHLDEAGWAALLDSDEPPHGHPQLLLGRLLARVGVGRAAVTALGARPDAARARLLSQALRPAETTDLWARGDPAERVDLAESGLAGLAVVEAADEREEALAAAIALREALETPGRTAMLITPDRGLAARVIVELRRWDIEAADAAGIALTTTPAGVLARLAADVATHDAATATVFALIAHPWLRLGLDREAVERAAAALEIGVLRAPGVGAGFASLIAAAEARSGGEAHTPRPRRRLDDEAWDAAADLARRLAAAFEGFEPPPGDALVDFAALAERHRVVLDRLTAGPDDATAVEPSAIALGALLDELALSEGGLTGSFAEYPAFLATLMAERCVPPVRTHPRLAVLGPLEARLAHADRVVLAGLDEGVWPPRAESDAFLNRPMRGRIGLDPPERRIGLSAHDFVTAACTPDAVVTRAAKRGGAPTVPSRFLQRVAALAGPDAWGACTRRGARYRQLAAALDRGPPMRRVARPAPRSDPELFPRVLAIGEVETLLLDPYAIHARHGLGLDPLDAVARVPGAAERGALVHAVLKTFVADHPGALPPDADTRLLRIGRDLFAPLAATHPQIHAEWWPRFERLAPEFIAWEQARRPNLARVHAAIRGHLDLPEGVTLTARIDRVEVGADGGLVLIDYKTGAAPSGAEVRAGLAPQLTLLAALVARGAFRDLPAQAPSGLAYLRVSGGREPLEERAIRSAGEPLAALAEAHFARLRSLVARFLAGEAAYPSRPHSRRNRAGSPYDHLARVREWSLAEDPEEG